ncbi:hypothetical protein MLGJGCBP_03861 [Rhodococcus sp. T7]|nr:hypothetical protein MLGJGCBP_03861 [Rhodococcus sp. T7]
MNNPTIDSTPGNCGGRPDTVAPNTTSSRDVIRPNNTPHAACITVLTVTPTRAANDDNRAVTCSPNETATSPEREVISRPGSAGANRVGSSTPDNARDHTSRDTCRSCSPSHTRYDRYERTRGNTDASPPVAYNTSRSFINNGIDQPSSRM